MEIILVIVTQHWLKQATHLFVCTSGAADCVSTSHVWGPVNERGWPTRSHLLGKPVSVKGLFQIYKTEKVAHRRQHAFADMIPVEVSVTHYQLGPNSPLGIFMNTDPLEEMITLEELDRILRTLGKKQLPKGQ